MTKYRVIKYVKHCLKNPWVVFPALGSMGLLNWLPDSLYLRCCFRAKVGYKLDLKNPQTFNEKLQWLKLHDRNPQYTQMVDKYAVRDYIATTIGEEYLIPLLGVWDSFEEIDFDTLPNQFVLKCNHDSGTIVICKDKKMFDIDAARKKINARINYNYYYSWREWPYKNVQHKIIAEQYVSDGIHEDITDYKILVFNGKVKCEFACTNRRSAGGLNITVFDREWNRLPFSRHYPVDPGDIPRPNKLGEMILLSEILAQSIGTPFVRIDLYDVSGKLLFGEITFYPGSGMEEFIPFSWDKRLGDWISLEMGNDII